MSELIEPVPALHDALLLLPAPARNVTAALLPVLPRGAEGLQARTSVASVASRADTHICWRNPGAMAKIQPYEAHADRYDAWFERHEAAYIAELLALRPFVPLSGHGLEIGVGSGRFAAPLGVRVGIDPSRAMLGHARARGLEVVQGVAEALPFEDSRFDHVLVVTTLCFVDSPQAMLLQARRVLRPGGDLVLGFIDRDSSLGRHYESHREASVFYRDATFYSAGEVERLLVEAGFDVRSWAQTLTHALADDEQIEAARPGHGQGGFVVVHARNDKVG